MNKNEFIRRLRELLSDLPYADREDAIRFYNDYFDDAGPENEASVLAELVSPEKVSEMIHSESGEIKQYPIPMRLSAAEGNAGEERKEDTARDAAYRETGSYDSYSQGYTTYKDPDAANAVQNFLEKVFGTDRRTRNNRIALIILAILLIILAFPTFGGLFTALGVILVAPLALLIGFGVCSFVAVVIGVCLVAGGIAMMFSAPAAGMILIGAGFLCFAGSILLSFATGGMGELFKLCLQGLKKLFGWIGGLWENRKEVRE